MSAKWLVRVVHSTVCSSIPLKVVKTTNYFCRRDLWDYPKATLCKEENWLNCLNNLISADKNENCLTHSRLISVVDIEGPNTDKPNIHKHNSDYTQTQTQKYKPQQEEKKQILKVFFMTSDLCSRFVIIHLGLRRFNKKKLSVEFLMQSNL